MENIKLDTTKALSFLNADALKGYEPKVKAAQEALFGWVTGVVWHAFGLVYYAMGKDDFLYGTVAPTRAMLDKYGIAHVYNETAGGHTWINWRRYLADFAPRLFR